MTRRGRSVLLWGGALAVGALLLFAFGYFPQEILRDQVERRLQEALGPGSSIRRMHVVPGRLSTDVYGLVVEGPSYKLTVPRARLVLGLLTVLLLGSTVAAAFLARRARLRLAAPRL